MPDAEPSRRPEPDRRIRQAGRLARVLRILEMIQGRGRYGVKELAGELDCSARTVFRDLNVLELAGVPWFFDDDDRCYRVRPDFRFPPVKPRRRSDHEEGRRRLTRPGCSSP